MIGMRARLTVFESSWSASIAPGTAKAGLVMRAVINMCVAPCHIGWLASVTALTNRIARM